MWCFFFNDTATTEIYTLSLHDALPISMAFLNMDAGAVERYRPHNISWMYSMCFDSSGTAYLGDLVGDFRDRKSTRLNSSHANISYAVFCLKKKSCSSQARTPDLRSL